jgi:hypothetical protein
METKEIQVKDGLEGSVGTALPVAAQNGVRARPLCIGVSARLFCFPFSALGLQWAVIG